MNCEIEISKNIKIFLLVVFILAFISGYSSVQALTLSVYDLGENIPLTNEQLFKGNVMLLSDDDFYYFGWNGHDVSTYAYLYAGEISVRLSGSSRSSYDFYKIDKVTKDCIPIVNDNNLHRGKNILLSTLDFQHDSGIFTKNYSTLMTLSHGDKFQIENNGSSIFDQKLILKLSQLAEGLILVNDENNDFYQQYAFNLGSGLNIEIDLPVGETSIIYVYFLPTHITENLSFSLLEYDYLKITEYVPTYKITGQSTVLLNSLIVPGEVPYIQTNYTTSAFYQYMENNVTYTRILHLPANQKINLQSNKTYLIKFRHEPTTTISVRSNFKLQSTDERISFLSDDELEDLIINNGGSVTETTNPSKIIEVNRTKVLKVTSKRTGIFTNVMAISVQGSANSNALISRYGIQADIPGSLIKLGEYKQTGNQGKFNVVVPNDDGYVVVEENSGITTVVIDGKYKEGTDYTVELINKSDYVKDEAVEDNYRQYNPDPTDIDKGDGYVNKQGDSIIGNIFDNWNQGNDVGSVDISSKLQGLLSPLSAFMDFVSTLFTSVPEISALVAFGLMAGIIMFILGR